MIHPSPEFDGAAQRRQYHDELHMADDHTARRHALPWLPVDTAAALPSLGPEIESDQELLAELRAAPRPRNPVVQPRKLVASQESITIASSLAVLAAIPKPEFETSKVSRRDTLARHLHEQIYATVHEELDILDRAGIPHRGIETTPTGIFDRYFTEVLRDISPYNQTDTIELQRRKARLKALAQFALSVQQGKPEITVTARLLQSIKPNTRLVARQALGLVLATYGRRFEAVRRQSSALYTPVGSGRTPVSRLSQDRMDVE